MTPINYDNRTLASDEINVPCNIVYNEQTTTLTEAGTYTLKCAKKKMITDVQIGDYTLKCADKVMKSDVVVELAEAAEEEDNTNYLCFTAGNNDVNFSNDNRWLLEYSFDKITWQTYASRTSVTIPANTSLYLRGDSSSGTIGYNSNRFYGLSGVTLSGDVTTLLNKVGNVATVPEKAFYFMFDSNSIADVSNLILPSITVQSYGYAYMFGATNITKGPVIYATNLYSDACTRMFYSCSKLQEISVNFTSWNSSSTYNWVSGVNSNGVFKCNSTLPIEYGMSRIPTGWTVENI